jgi:tetratricopeptide (TPR) repeat protein
MIAFGRALIKVAPPGLHPNFYVFSAEAIMSLQKFHEAEELLHEGLAACRHEGRGTSRVSRRIRQSPHSLPGKRVEGPPAQRPTCASSAPQISSLLAVSVLERRGDKDEALRHAQRAVQTAREEYVHTTREEAVEALTRGLRTEALVLDSLGRLDEAVALDAEWQALAPGLKCADATVRRALKHREVGQYDEAEQLLRPVVYSMWLEWPKIHTSQMVESIQRPGFRADGAAREEGDGGGAGGGAEAQGRDRR